MHISDLHFGREDGALADRLPAALHALDPAPALTIVGGDLSQRARPAQLAAAAAWLLRLPAPRLVLAGNHDLGLLEWRAWRDPRKSRFARAIAGDLDTGPGTDRRADLDPTYLDDELAVAGVNTARAWAWKRGRIGRAQVRRTATFLRDAGPARLRVVVTHHPFVTRPASRRVCMAPRALAALADWQDAGLDLLLAGHFHQSFAATAGVPGRPPVLVLQAGTAISDRRRREPNAFTVIDVDGGALNAEVHRWDGRRYAARERTPYRREGALWVSVPGAAS